MRCPSLTTISVLVPMSTSIVVPPWRASSVATRSAATSPPTWLATSGAPTTRPCGCMKMPSSWARRVSHVESASPRAIASSVTDL